MESQDRGPLSQPDRSARRAIVWPPHTTTAQPRDPSVIVLAVDDDPAILQLVADTLRDDGIEVEQASNGLEALDRLDRIQPDAIVLDLEMPVMDGRTFYRQLRASGRGIPVLILSAHGARTARTQLGADAAIEKPFRAAALLDQVRTIVRPR